METMTVEQVLEITVKMLSGISVPATMTEQIGIPVFRAIGNLNECMNAIERQKEQEMEKAPEFRIIDSTESDEESEEETEEGKEEGTGENEDA